MWKNILGRGRSLMTVWRMSLACQIPEATDAHRFVILIAFTLLLLQERSSLRYKYVTLPVLL
jgi:hypothetical protein